MCVCARARMHFDDISVSCALYFVIMKSLLQHFDRHLNRFLYCKNYCKCYYLESLVAFLCFFMGICSEHLLKESFWGCIKSLFQIDLEGYNLCGLQSLFFRVHLVVSFGLQCWPFAAIWMIWRWKGFYGDFEVVFFLE